MKYGWFLPYTPQIRENGAWKYHYIHCILSISSSPLKRVCLNESFNLNLYLFQNVLILG